jgi:maleate cis-trans isomerase
MTRRIRVMIVLPENNTTIEPEISALCPALAPLAVARVKRPPRTLLLDDLPAYTEATLEAIAPFSNEAANGLFKKEPWDLVIYGCTAAGFLGGPDSNAAMVDRLRERTGATVISTAGAMVDVLRANGITETAVVTPYLQPVNDGLRRYLETSGIEIEVLNSFFCETTAELGAITEHEVLELARQTVTPSSKSLFVACSQLPTLHAISRLRRDFAIPVWSSIQATAWASVNAMTAKGLPAQIEQAM